MSPRLLKGLFLTFLILLSTTACASAGSKTSNSQWSYADLKLLTPTSSIPPDQDLIAIYSRIIQNEIQFRLDFLDLTEQPGSDIYLAVDFDPGGTRKLPLDGLADIDWDLLAVVPSSGIPFTLYPNQVDSSVSSNKYSEPISPSHRMIPTVSRVPWNDYTVITLNLGRIGKLPNGYKTQVFITSPATSTISDNSLPFRNDDPPPKRAPLVLAFWNTFPAYTPAQAIRRWDGAHTGPSGERHGLSVLLHSVRRNRVPIVLLDLGNPNSLSALDFIGGIPLVKELVNARLVTLADPLPGSPSYPLFPDGLPEWANRYALAEVRQIKSRYSLPSGQIAYTPREPVGDLSGYAIIFARINQQSSTFWKQTRVLPVPDQRSTVSQATVDGLSMSVRQVLLQNALDNSKSQGARQILLILGGSLIDSNFGDPRASEASLAYIASHPWIEVLDAEDLTSLPAETVPMLLPGFTSQVDASGFSPNPQFMMIEHPEQEPTNPIYQMIWESALALYAPLPPESNNLPILRSNYIGQVGFFLDAATWADRPFQRNNCYIDPNKDGIPDCVNANQQLLSLIGISGGRIISLTYLDKDGAHQIIAPSTTFVVGLSDPSSWVLEAGEGADIAGYLGAFYDQTLPWDLFYPSPQPNSLNLTKSDQRIAKTMFFKNDGIQVIIRSLDEKIILIPLALDPWFRYYPGWGKRYHKEIIPRGYAWYVDGGPRVEIQSDHPMEFYSFIDAYPYFINQEDPNRSYPPGHYLPFPMAIARVKGSGVISIDLKIK